VSVLDAPVRAPELGTAAGTYTIEVGEARASVPGGSAPGADPTAPAILVRPDWARLDGGDLPGVVGEVRFRGPHTDYHVATPAGPLLIRETGPPRFGGGPVRWSLLRARLMPRG
jgi:TOBE domain